MSITVDEQTLAAEELGFETLGDVLEHAQKGNRFVVGVLIDGEEPNFGDVAELRKERLADRTIYVETVDALQMAVGVLDEAATQLADADAARADAARFLRDNDLPRAMEKLGACFTIWQSTQQAILKVGELLKVDLTALQVDGEALVELLISLTERLKLIKGALENRDYVLLGDILEYEMGDFGGQWEDAVAALREKIGG